jgi:hypothetical protein
MRTFKYETRLILKEPEQVYTPEQMRVAQKWIAHRLGYGPPLDDRDRAVLAKEAERVERLLEAI